MYVRPSQFLCVCMIIHAADVSTMAPVGPIREAAQPRYKKPRKSNSSATGATTTVINNNWGHEPSATARRYGSSSDGDDPFSVV